MTYKQQKIKILFIITQSEFGGAQRFLYDLVTNLNQNKYDFIVAAGPQGNDKNGLLARLQREDIKTYPLRLLKREINPINDIKAIFEIKNLIEGLKPDIIYLNSTKAGILGSLALKRPHKFGLLFEFIENITRYFSQKFNFSIKSKDKFLTNQKIIYRIGGWVFNEPMPKWKKWLYILAEKWTAKYKDIIITNSKSDQKKANKFGVKPKNRIVTIYNGIDAPSLKFLPREEARKKLFSDNQFSIFPSINSGSRTKLRDNFQFSILVGCVANFYPSKGLEYLIEAAYSISKSNPREIRAENPRESASMIFVIIGDGRERKKLEKLIKKYGLQNNFFLSGNINNAYKYLKAFDIFVLPSIKEGMPWCLLEAMAAETPVIATDVGGIPEIINHETHNILARRSQKNGGGSLGEGGKHGTITETGGIIIKPKDPKQIVEAIKILIKNKNLGLQFVKNARKTVEEKFNLKKMIEENEKILDKAI